MFPLQAAHETEIPKSFVSGTSHFQRDVTYSTQTFQVICDIFHCYLNLVHQLQAPEHPACLIH